MLSGSEPGGITSLPFTARIDGVDEGAITVLDHAEGDCGPGESETSRGLGRFETAEVAEIVWPAVLKDGDGIR